MLCSAQLIDYNRLFGQPARNLRDIQVYSLPQENQAPRKIPELLRKRIGWLMRRLHLKQAGRYLHFQSIDSILENSKFKRDGSVDEAIREFQ